MTLFGFQLWYIILCAAGHFILSASVGYLVYWLTSIILLRITSMTDQESFLFGFSTHQFSLLLALLFSVFVHILQDYVVHIF